MTGCFKRAIVILTVLGGFGLGPGAVGLKAAAPDVEPGSPVPAAAGNAMPVSAEKQYTGDRISLDFQNADIHNLIRIIGEVSGKTIVMPEAVSGKVTLKLRDVPWDQALYIILSSQNLGYEETGDVLRVYRLPVLLESSRRREGSGENKLGDINALPRLAKKVFTPKYSPVGVVNAELNKHKSGRGKIVAVGNDIYVEDEPAAIAVMTQMFMRIDRAVRQILIEARIVESTTAFAWKHGLLRFDDLSGDGEVPAGDGAAQGPPTETPEPVHFTGDPKLEVVLLNKADASLLKAIIKNENSLEVRTISAPRIMAANDQEVTVKQGRQGCGHYRSGSSASTAANVQFREFALELRVRPHIGETGDAVTLDLDLSHPHAVVGSTDEPRLYPDPVKTTVMVKDGETIAVGSVVADGIVSSDGRVGRRSVSLMDWFYPERRSVDGRKPEQLIFITATIIPINI